LIIFLIESNEIVQLQDRLASTEAQMCKILSVLDSASDKVNKITKDTKKSQKVEIKLLIFFFRFSIKFLD
jgi:hypothetical protein